MNERKTEQTNEQMNELAGKDVSPGDLTTLTDKFVKANGRLHDLKKQQTDLEAKLAHDYGLEGAFGALVDKCYDAQVHCLQTFPMCCPHQGLTYLPIEERHILLIKVLQPVLYKHSIHHGLEECYLMPYLTFMQMWWATEKWPHRL